MAKFLLKTKNEQNIKDKPRVYFTCHPDDFERYFEKICEDIFKSHDCAIYYTENMSEDIPENERETDLGRMNLFVVPVTFKLLTKPCRAMQTDIAYAKEQHIRILPLMMETGINEFYKKPENFGEMQYLSPFASDLTEIGYEEKLKKYLDSSLLSGEMMNRIRKAFDAYIFLSYRKKDRAYANELMKMIHRHPECRDIAIWYDEFLTPGESFKENITRALENSKLFTLLVTPNLLEEPNFVKDVEYPEAKKAGKDILPVEMEDTDRAQLEEKYEDIPACANPYNDENFKFLLNSALKIATSENDDDPEHNFLIGLAYIEGIDVEVDTEKGFELITSAAEAELPEAMKWLYNEYTHGRFINYSQALVWAQKCVDYYTCRYGENNADSLISLNNLALAYSNCGDYKNALEFNQKCYELHCEFLGKEHPNTLTSLSNLACSYYDLGNHQKALELMEKVYDLRCKVLGEEHPFTLKSKNYIDELRKKLSDQ